MVHSPSVLASPEMKGSDPTGVLDGMLLPRPLIPAELAVSPNSVIELVPSGTEGPLLGYL